MKHRKILHRILFIFTFLYLLMCPEAHVLGETIRHDLVVHKRVVQILKKDFCENFHSIPIGLIKTSATESSLTSTHLQKCPIFQSFNSTFILSSLSTVRLILWVLHILSTVFQHITASPFYFSDNKPSACAWYKASPLILHRRNSYENKYATPKKKQHSQVTSTLSAHNVHYCSPSHTFPDTMQKWYEYLACVSFPNRNHQTRLWNTAEKP